MSIFDHTSGGVRDVTRQRSAHRRLLHRGATEHTVNITLGNNDDVALDAMSPERTPSYRVAQGSKSELDEPTTGRAVQYSVFRK